MIEKIEKYINLFEQATTDKDRKQLLLYAMDNIADVTNPVMLTFFNKHRSLMKELKSDINKEKEKNKLTSHRRLKITEIYN